MNPKFRQPSILFLPLLMMAGSCQLVNSEPEKPNIVFIMTDDQAWNLLSRDGRYPFMQTPNLDKLADEGTVFRNAFVTTSLCSPSRASFLTGCYAHKHGVMSNDFKDPDPALPMFQEIMQESGYETAFIGKWHMKEGAQPRKGFDYWLSFDRQGVYFNPKLNENGREFTEKGYTTEILTDFAVKWMKKEHNKPVCMMLWHKAVHAPFSPAPRDSAAFSNDSIPEYENWYDSMEGKPEWLRRGMMYGIKPREWKESIGKPVPEMIIPKPWNPRVKNMVNYMRAMIAVDRSVGSIMECLKELDMMDNTIIVFASDNGYFIGSHQRGDKRLMYEESIRIPLIVRYPFKGKGGNNIDNQVLNIDVAPTLIDIAGGKVPQSMQGKSFLPLLEGKEVEWRKSFLYEYFQEEYAPGIVTMTGVRNERYKYIHYPKLVNDIDELYDLSTDQEEMNNLINVIAYKTVLNEMKAELAKLMKENEYRSPIAIGADVNSGE